MPLIPVIVLKRRATAAQDADKRAAATNDNRAIRATRLRSCSRSSHSTTTTIFELEAEPLLEPKPDPLELVYNICQGTIRLAPRSTVLRQNVTSNPLQNLPVHCPPLLVDGRMQIVHIPKWKRTVGFYWRSCNGERTEVRWRNVRLPWKIWMERNLGESEKWTELWIERV
jgi:hypothetical protein